MPLAVPALAVFALALSFAAPRPAAAQLTSPPGIEPPKVIHQEEPDYTEKARKAGIEGTVLLRIVITVEGVPTDIRVTKSLDAGLDKEAVKAVSRWRFEPARKDGVPVAIEANIEVNFRIENPPSPA